MIADRREPVPLELPQELRGLRVLVFGLGRFGGGLGAVRFFCDRGAEVTVTDRASAQELADSLEQLSALPIHTYQLGRHVESDFRRAQWVVVNPAVPPHNAFLDIARRSGAVLVTEMDLFLRWCPSRWIAGITGTNGKSTTTDLTYRMLQASGLRAHLGGNIGRSLLCEIDAIEPDDRVVVELSSFQLERLQPDTPRPRAVAITHYSPNHLDWHGTEDEYLAAKGRLLSAVGVEDGIAALPADQPHYARWSAYAKPRRIIPFAGDHVPPTGCGVDEHWLTRTDESGRIDSFVDLAPTPLRGKATRANAACATAIAGHLGATVGGITRAILDFRALPHRQEIVGRARGLQFINDSKATTPEATASALEAYAPDVVVIAGGSSKGVSFEILARALTRHARVLVVYGATAEEIERCAIDAGFPNERIARHDTLPEAFRAALRLSQPGDTVLLSPACASFDQFTNYEERGDLFRRLVHEWIATRE
ncbi:MAG: UDP-N-acetylmuramoyl-L-alanine--D-glutamate ligase [Planctomycetes bacterium]|nr:UDP-N-acetylmuramoyl-L-alanine--D-glutamate ligase [Planctomycetota bacterium]